MRFIRRDADRGSEIAARVLAVIVLAIVVVFVLAAVGVIPRW